MPDQLEVNIAAVAAGLDKRIGRALTMAILGTCDGEHHKMWVIDQMVRALTGCPLETITKPDIHGEPFSYQAQGRSREYERWLHECKLEGSWDEGVAP